MLGHAWTILFPNHPLPWPGTQAVVVFFALSGFVIAFVADGREKTLVEYALRRAARGWSVAIPAILLAGIITFAVGASEISVAAPPATSLADLLGRSMTNLLFLGQLWILDIQSPLNAPFWSLNYEVWYYALFGAWTYLRGRRRVIALSALSVISGPKILLMLPCWLAGRRLALSSSAHAADMGGAVDLRRFDPGVPGSILV
jgi:peptidoglycan/LPS O-acetylase OafA/YrhL